MGVPVVSTSVGCEGIGVVHGKHLLIADTEEAFAAQIGKLSTNPRLADELTRNAKALVHRKYRWGDIGKSLERVYKDVIAAKARSIRRAKKR